MVKVGHELEQRFTTEKLIFIDDLNQEAFEYNAQNDSLIPLVNFEISNTTDKEIPTDGDYHFEVAFAEWQGKSMGAEVIVTIKGDSAKIAYAGGGNLTAEIGEILDEGIIMMHKSGNWIIGRNKSDSNIDEIGGCTGGPAIIDFKNKKYWMC